jgi:hypothetical protein
MGVDQHRRGGCSGCQRTTTLSITYITIDLFPDPKSPGDIGVAASRSARMGLKAQVRRVRPKPRFTWAFRAKAPSGLGGCNPYYQKGCDQGKWNANVCSCNPSFQLSSWPGCERMFAFSARGAAPGVGPETGMGPDLAARPHAHAQHVWRNVSFQPVRSNGFKRLLVAPDVGQYTQTNPCFNHGSLQGRFLVLVFPVVTGPTSEGISDVRT